MAKLSIVAGATSQSVNVFIQNSSVTTGAGLTGLVFNSGSLKAYYTFGGANTTSVAISLATLATVTTAYSSGGFIEIDATNMPGLYRLDIPNAALATSKGRSSVIMLSGATNMVPCVLEVELTAVDNQSTGFGLVNASANVVQWNSSAVVAPNVAGIPLVDAKYILGTIISTPATAGILDVNIKNISNATVSATTAQIGTNVVNWNNTVVATPATAGIPDINVKNMNNVAATSITTINANQGTTQPLNFTGTGASALVKSDMVDVAGSAVSASTAQLGVNVVNVAGSASAGAAGYMGVDWGHVNAPTTTVGLTGTTISTTQAITSVSGAVGSVTGNVGGSVASVTARVTANTDQLNGQTVTAAAGVTFPTSVASPTNITAGTITTVTNLTNAPTAGDFTATMKTSLNAATPASVVGAVGSVTGNVGGNVVGSVASVTASVKVDGTSALTESYAAQGAALTLAQGIYGMNQLMSQQGIAGTTLTTKKRDGSTVAKTYTLDSATAPTTISETT